ncbi:hypothetical protein Hanom_Chr06g00490911 [Helianthus anomalus]
MVFKGHHPYGLNKKVKVKPRSRDQVHGAKRWSKGMKLEREKIQYDTKRHHTQFGFRFVGPKGPRRA